MADYGIKMTDFAKVFEGIATLLWPVIILLLIFLFKPAIAALIESAKSRKFTVKVGGQELTMEEVGKLERTLIADLQSQVLELRRKLEGGAQPKSALPEAAPTGRPSRAKTILWVDDNPKNNSYFVQQLTDRGFTVDLARSTSEGLRQFDRGQYGLIISDMGRTEEGLYKPTAGLDLLKGIRALKPDIPFIIYTSSRAIEERESEAKALQVTSITSSPTELFDVLQKEIGRMTA